MSIMLLVKMLQYKGTGLPLSLMPRTMVLGEHCGTSYSEVGANQSPSFCSVEQKVGEPAVWDPGGSPISNWGSPTSWSEIGS